MVIEVHVHCRPGLIHCLVLLRPHALAMRGEGGTAVNGKVKPVAPPDIAGGPPSGPTGSAGQKHETRETEGGKGSSFSFGGLKPKAAVAAPKVRKCVSWLG